MLGRSCSTNCKATTNLRHESPRKITMTERELFDAALAFEDPVERAAFRDHECAGDDRLRRHVGRLLDAFPRLDCFLETPVGTLPDPAAVTAKPGDVIGSYKLLQQVGEGGFGVVFMAEQL